MMIPGDIISWNIARIKWMQWDHVLPEKTSDLYEAISDFQKRPWITEDEIDQIAEPFSDLSFWEYLNKL